MYKHIHANITFVLSKVVGVWGGGYHSHPYLDFISDHYKFQTVNTYIDPHNPGDLTPREPLDTT